VSMRAWGGPSDAARCSHDRRGRLRSHDRRSKAQYTRSRVDRVPGVARSERIGEVVVENVEIGATDAGTRNGEDSVPRPRIGPRFLNDTEQARFAIRLLKRPHRGALARPMARITTRRGCCATPPGQ